MKSISRWMILLTFLVSPIGLFGQESTTLSLGQRVLQELENIHAEAKGLTDKLAVIGIRAKVANLLWPSDRARARAIFHELWEEVERAEEGEFDREAARVEILKNLFPRDPALARRWLEQVAAGRRSESAPFQLQIAGTDPNLKRLAALSAQLLERNPEIAASLLEQHLAVSVSPAAFSSLLRLREKDPRLADYIVAQVLERLRERPTVVALPALYVLVDYLFPDPRLGRSLRPPEALLQRYYFSTAYDLLQGSLAESESHLRGQGYTEPDLRFRSLFQGRVAMVLSALASRLAPEREEELRKLVARLAANLPPEANPRFDPVLARISDRPMRTETVEEAFSLALARGDLAGAKRLLEKVADGSTRRMLWPALAQAELHAHMVRDQYAEALIIARQIEDVHLRATLYARISRSAFQKGEKELARLALMEAQLALSGAPDPSGVRVGVLLSLASDAAAISDALSWSFLWSAVSLLNALPEESGKPTTGDLRGQMQMEVRRHLREAPELWQAFSAVSRMNFDDALLAAHQIRDEVLRLLARLAVCEAWVGSAHLGRDRSER
ncbi:hypothetical protein HRbin10_02468 [bacterium HR10]|nr:hypothetical protein HRbin10_02468 [bacterium HR10]